LFRYLNFTAPKGPFVSIFVWRCRNDSDQAIPNRSDAAATNREQPRKLCRYRIARDRLLPFKKHERDPEQEYFSDGISEDIITALSKLRWFFVDLAQLILYHKASPSI